MKVYTESGNLQVEFIRYLKKNVDFINVYFCEETDSMQYRPPNPNLDGGCPTVHIVTGDNGRRHLSIVTHGRLR